MYQPSSRSVRTGTPGSDLHISFSLEQNLGVPKGNLMCVGNLVPSCLSFATVPGGLDSTKALLDQSVQSEGESMRIVRQRSMRRGVSRLNYMSYHSTGV